MNSGSEALPQGLFCYYISRISKILPRLVKGNAMSKILKSTFFLSAMLVIGVQAPIAFASPEKGGVVAKDTIPYEHWALPATMRSVSAVSYTHLTLPTILLV